MDNINEEMQVIKTVDENGDEVELKLYDIVNVEGVDYAILFSSDEEINEDSEGILMKMKQENGEYVFETIDDDDEFEAVAKILSEEDECDCEHDCNCHIK
ncbi:MAG: DUF1292 domain-containing protein [Candidatus Gastranaerophilales bacterium]|nr:DUF1292 domain-containing protein [Candidatus Gastranaerophilales bacterium]